MAEEENNEWKKTVEGVIRRVQLFLDADSTRSFTPSFVSQMLQCFRDAHNLEVCNLRVCLTEAVQERCAMCANIDSEASAASGTIVCDNTCKFMKWRKALEGKL